MRRRLLTCVISLVVWIVPVVHAAPVRAAQAAPGHSHSSHSQGKLMTWDDTFLAARIFFGPLPAAMPGSKNDTPERIALGKRLYFERGISINKNKSCHDCHLLTQGRSGTDNTPTSKGATGVSGKRNTPTVINAGFQSVQFWDGRAPNLVEQAKGPILNPIEMALRTPEEVIERLRHEPGYLDAFRRAFPGDPDPITFEHLAEAIAAFERTLIAPGRFDRMLSGDKKAMNAQAKRGLAKFIQYNCVDCHSSSTVGGQIYRKFGQEHPYSTDDQGRYEITRKEEDRFVFKVPILRNVTRTPPYFHDGQVFTIEEAVAKMGWHQLDHRLTRDDVEDLVAFLRTLEGNPPRVEAPK